MTSNARPEAPATMQKRTLIYNNDNCNLGVNEMKPFELERKLRNERRERRTQDTNDKYLMYALSVMVLFCVLAVFINEVVR